MTKLKACPKCNAYPKIGYACGEFFVIGGTDGCEVCGSFTEMHSTEEQEVDAWNEKQNNHLPGVL